MLALAFQCGLKLHENVIYVTSSCVHVGGNFFPGHLHDSRTELFRDVGVLMMWNI